MRRNGNGFTLMELLVVVAIIGILVGILVPALAIARQLAQLGACKSNVKGIHTAIKMYETADNRLPMIRTQPTADADVNGAPDSTTGTDDKLGENGDDWSDLGDQAMQNMWLLIANNNLGEGGFRCPADQGYEDRESDFKYGWTSPYQYSYGLQWPYARDAGGTRNLAAFQSNMNDGLVILSDWNPCLEGATEGLTEAGEQPSNHGSHGTVVLSWAGTVESHKDDSLAGIGGDDIYTGGSTGTVGDMPGGTADDYEASEDTSIALPGRN